MLNSDDVTAKNALVLDLMGTLAAVFGLFSLLMYQFAGYKSFDGIGAMVIGVSTAVLAVVLILGLRGLVVGERAPTTIENKIKAAALEIRQVEEILDLRTMQVGPDRLLVDIELHIQDGLSTDELEALIEKIKKRIKDEVPAARYLQVEPGTPE